MKPPVISQRIASTIRTVYATRFASALMAAPSSALVLWLIAAMAGATTSCAPPVCSAGESRECTCTGGGRGTQRCFSTGEGYAECMCNTGACASPLSTCGTLCVDLRSDNSNCGSCGNRCASTQNCISSVCQTGCLSPRTQCSAGCFDLGSDESNCGSCGNRCATGASCVSGTCESSCAAPRTQCSSGCVDLSSDETNCGSCGARCNTGSSCVSGVCRSDCPSPRRVCSGACVDVTTDASNCGSCFNACPSGVPCRGGVCVDMCASYTSCGTCSPVIGCGWCANTAQCRTGTASGPNDFSCSGTNWDFEPIQCAPSPTDHRITCVDTALPRSASQSRCTCTADSNTGVTRYSGDACGMPLLANEFCCAQSGYPGTRSCSCYQRSYWACEDRGSRECNCDYYITPPSSTVTQCDNLPGPSGVPWRCCAATWDTCNCLEGRTSCPAGQRTVSNCSTASAAGALPPVNSCPTGTTPVSACSMGL